jgi:hypothetical protein
MVTAKAARTCWRLAATTLLLLIALLLIHDPTITTAATAAAAPMSKTGTFYDTLEVKPTASADAIKKAYRTLAKKYHPDKSDDPQAQAKFIEVSSAYETLSDPSRRREYDMELSAPKFPSHQGSRGHQGRGYPQNHHPFGRDPMSAFQNGRGGGYAFETRTVNGRTYTFSYSFGHQGHGSEQWFGQAAPPSLLSQLWTALWLSPLPMIFTIVGVYWCFSGCCGGKTIKQEETAPRPAASRREIGSDVQSIISQRKCIAVVPCNKASLQLLSDVKIAFRSDPICFCTSDSRGIGRSDSEWIGDSTLSVVATSKGGARWCLLSASTCRGETARTVLGDWLVKLLNGEVKWVDTSVEKPPHNIIR